MLITDNNATGLYASVCESVLQYGRRCKPRDLMTRELTGATLVLSNPQKNVVVHPVRKLSYVFMCAEFLWMFLGRNDVWSISRFNKNITQFSDDGQTFGGAYGPKIVEQLGYVLSTLQNDPDSRQAVLTIWRERPGKSADIPCTIMMHFMRREDRLEMFVYIRSNDVWLGLPYDLFNFTMIQSYVAAYLGIQPGKYTHFVGSLHAYERDFAKMAELVKKESLWSDIERPLLSAPMPPGVAVWFSLLASKRYFDTEIGTEGHIIRTMREEVQATPWEELLEVLAFQKHKHHDYLPEFWQKVYAYGRP